MPKIVQSAFDELAAMVLDPAHPSIQYTEGRRMFHAGVLWAIGELERTSQIPDDPHGDKCYQHMEMIRNECVEFGESVKSGQA